MPDTKDNTNFWNINKFVDRAVAKDILYFHNKGNYHFAETFTTKLNFPSLPLAVLASLEGADTELSPFHHTSIPCPAIIPIQVEKRARSATVFSSRTIPFAKVQTLLHESFSANAEKRRPYPSGGALYSVEVLCCLLGSRFSQGPQSGIYHYRPNLQVLQRLQDLTEEIYHRRILGSEHDGMQQANFILIYIVHLSKAIVKYRYRGYRLAWMEVGAMFQQADLVGKALGLSNKLSSSFNDHELTKFIALDNTSFMPAIMQLFGTKK